MPSKNGFGNSRTPLTRKAQYGVDQKNPIMKKKEKVKLTEDEKTGAFINDFIKLRKKKKEVKFMGGIENYNKAKKFENKPPPPSTREVDDMAYRRHVNRNN